LPYQDVLSTFFEDQNELPNQPVTFQYLTYDSPLI
jgi:hypothetical protein